MDRRHGKLDARHALEQFRHLIPLPRQLGWIGEGLVLTPPALAKEGTTRFHPVRTGAQDLDEVRFREGGMIAKHPSPHLVTGQRMGDKDHPLAMATDALAEIREGLNLKLQLLVIGEGFGMEFGGDTGHGIEPAKEAPS